MKEHPLLLTGEMVRAVLDGRKRQTRRPAKKLNHDMLNNLHRFDELKQSAIDSAMTLAPWEVGDLLWVRETIRVLGRTLGDNPPELCFEYRSGLDQRPITTPAQWQRCEDLWKRYKNKWIPSIHMPRWASRLSLKITEIKVEPVREISEADAFYEGVERLNLGPNEIGGIPVHPHTSSYQDAFKALWTKLYSAESWERDWCWAISFEVVK